MSLHTKGSILSKRKYTIFESRLNTVKKRYFALFHYKDLDEYHYTGCRKREHKFHPHLQVNITERAA